MKNINLKKVAFIVIDVIVVLILAGCVLLGVLGFNKNSNASGCVELRVTLDEEYRDDNLSDKAITDIENILKSKGYSFAAETRVEIASDTYKTLVFSVKGSQTEFDKLNLVYNENDVITFAPDVYISIKIYLESEMAVIAPGSGWQFNDEAPTVCEYRADLVGGAYSSKILQKNLIAMGVALLATLVYFLLRFRVASTVASLIATVLEFGLFGAMVLITRIPVDGTFYSVLFVVMVLSLIVGLIYNGLFRAEYKNPQELTDFERAEAVFKKGAKIVGGVCLALIVGLLIAVIIVPPTLKLLFALVALGTLLVGVSAIFTRPMLRYWLGLVKSEKKKGYSLHAKQKENKENI